jgi:translation elongation factor EF-1beta
MSMVAVVFKIYPKDGEFDKTVAELKAKFSPAGMQTEEIGFGIKMIKALFKFNDAENSSSQIEDKIRKLECVSEVEVYEESLL